MRRGHTIGHGETRPYTIRRDLSYRALSLLLVALCVGLTGGNAAGAGGARQSEGHAGLVVQFNDGTTNTYCLAFTGETINGLDLLLKTGLDVTAETQGALGGWVCKIGPDGCKYPEQVCACESYVPGGKYWVYNHLRNGAWKFSPLGPSNYKVRDGEVDGWAWSSGKGPSVTPSFAELCAAVLPSPPEPTATNPPPPPPPPPTDTPLPPRPTNTAVILPTGTPPPPAPTSTPKSTPRPHLTPTQPLAAPTRPPSQPDVPTATLQPPGDTPTPPPTGTPVPTDTPTVVPTSTHTPTPLPTSTPTTAPTPTGTPPPTATPSPTVIVRAAGPAPQAFAQMVAVGTGLAVVTGLALWWFGLRRRR